ncbi:Asp23/Gls24 family envelope stress response protein [Streptacidiphilus sp. ASG 303]|uniref:Asp23/Gls24 family envelope stress response protein n=1 Tax=Streptacidiphilus sp. ASG 303 TaxID=2896847 RepID=UPI001E55B103|nr:Asp23/Gls24 family envelope stress response protein [Streptacidiphilus sp. ASG 303]MCD0483675.1 Asp23/Gls24 family envelope stress response protein [Streptacidiphilus sp. ASG 303]
MSTPHQGRTGQPGSPERAEQPRLPPPAERGATVVPDRVVARIAARVARESLARLTGPGGGGLAAPQASAATGGGAARLELSLDLPYPVDIARASREVRDDVAARVSRMTGMEVREVALVVEHLVPRKGGGRVR